MSIQEVGSLAELQKAFNGNTYVIIDFWAEWCPPCKAIAPFYKKLADEHAIEGHLAFIKVNTEQASEVATAYKISSLPTFLFFKEGKQVMVHGQLQIVGGNPTALTAVAQKMGGLAAARKAAADAAP